jgi:hypothetical protein
MHFPQYRKYSNNKSYFKITSDSEFMEVQYVGSKKLIHEIKAIAYPEKLMIRDMLLCTEGRWIVIEESEFLSTIKN